MDKKIIERSKTIRDTAGRQVRVLEDVSAFELAKGFGCSLRSVYETALNAGICPYRYVRNRESISMEEQLQLSKSQVAVIGSGGLGGPILLLLARMGIGRLVAVDPDCFDETNLNRQALSSVPDLGRPKSEVAARVLKDVNPATDVKGVSGSLGRGECGDNPGRIKRDRGRPRQCAGSFHPSVALPGLSIFRWCMGPWPASKGS